MPDSRTNTRRILQFGRTTAAVWLAGAFLSPFPLPVAAAGQSPPRRILLPIEVAGESNTTSCVPVSLPTGLGDQARSLRMQVHGLEYAGMASVRLNESPWVALNNQSVAVAEPGRSYGGIGGGFATLTLTLALRPGSVADGNNPICFRFKGTNGVSSGFRVLAFNLLASDGRALLPAEAFEEEDPNLWTPPLADPANIAAGRALWNSAPLVANGLSNAPPIRAHCSDCHARDGRDLRYFNYSNASIEARSRFHGLSAQEGKQIASYIRALPLPNPGRPWNPPYQPGPGQRTVKAANWAAGAGLKWVLDRDSETLRYLFPASATGLAITPAAFAPDANLDPREIPIAFELPDWNHWLPRVHPKDAFGTHFDSSEFARLYLALGAEPPSSATKIAAQFDRWLKSRAAWLAPLPARESKKWTPALSEAFYSAQCWQLVKTWELLQQFGPEGQDGQQYSAPDRWWPTSIPAATAPAAVNIPDGPGGMGGSALTNEYYDNAWYALQVVLNSGNHRHRGRSPVDWVYLSGRFLDLERQSGRPEPGRLLVTLIKAMQSSDPTIGPENPAEGWQPRQMLDPRILVAQEWAPTFAPLDERTRRALLQSLVEAWLDKAVRYPAASYFHRAQLEGSYVLPRELRDISGGEPWKAASQFRAAGVDPLLIQRLTEWGDQYSTVASLFRY